MNATQRTLFDDPAPQPIYPTARKTDKATSHQAPEPSVLKGWRLRVYQTACDMPRASTARELAEAAADNPTEVETARKRIHELVRLGRLKEHQPRACIFTGKQATTYLPAT